MNKALLVSCCAVVLALYSLSGVPAGLAQGDPPESGCVYNPADDFKQTIVGTVDGDRVELTISARFGGAVESVKWRDKEFINIYDHGRQISYAWHFDGYSECLNPTEPGSARDGSGPTSTSELQQVCLHSENKLTTTTQPAFWLAPGERGFCSGGVEQAINETLISDQLLTKTIEIGYHGLDNVIAFTAAVSLNEPHEFMQLEIPTAYLTYEFNERWVFNPATGELSKPSGQDPVPPWSFMHFGSLPPILATSDGAYALGAYTAEPILSYSILGTNSPILADRTNKWNMVLRQEPAEPGEYTYQSFAILGTLESVQQAMRQLYLLHPSDLAPAEGYIDHYSCETIDGWAWIPGMYDEAVVLDVYRISEDGQEVLAKSLLADRYRVDLADALGDNGRHSFRLITQEVLPDSGRYRLRFHARQQGAEVRGRELTGSGFELSCAGFGPTAAELTERAPTATFEPTAAATLTSASAATAQPEGATGEKASNLPCIGGLFPMTIFAFHVARQRRGNKAAS